MSDRSTRARPRSEFQRRTGRVVLAVSGLGFPLTQALIRVGVSITAEEGHSRAHLQLLSVGLH